MHDLSVIQQFRQKRFDSHVDRSSAERPAGHIENRNGGIESKPFQPTIPIAILKRRTDGISGHHYMLCVFPGDDSSFFVANRERRRKTRRSPIRQTNLSSLLMRQHRRDSMPEYERRHTDRTASTENHVRAQFPDLPPAADNPNRNSQNIDEILKREISAQFSGGNRDEWHAIFVRQTTLNAVLAADPKQLMGNISSPKFLDHGNRGQHMSSGSATGNQNSGWSFLIAHNGPVVESRGCGVQCQPEYKRTTNEVSATIFRLRPEFWFAHFSVLD